MKRSSESEENNNTKQARFVERQAPVNNISTGMTPVDSEKTDKVVPINCPEKLVFVVDCSAESGEKCGTFEAGNEAILLDVIKKAILILISRKIEISPSTEFGLIEWRSSPQWRANLGSNRSQILSGLEKLRPNLVSEELCDINTLMESIGKESPVSGNNVDSSEAPDFVLRTILIYARKTTLPKSSERPFFSNVSFLDILYIIPITSTRLSGCSLESASASSSKQKEFESLEVYQAVYDDLLSWATAESYVLSTTAQSFALLGQSIRLLGHPLQRAPQSLCDYRINFSFLEEDAKTEEDFNTGENALVDFQLRE